MERKNRIINIKSYAAGQTIKISEKTIDQAQKANGFLLETGKMSMFVVRTVKEAFSIDFEFKEFLRQCYLIGNKSLPLVAITGFIMGVVLTIQTRPTLANFGAVSLLPSMVATSIIREIGPVITALICAGKIGSGMGAELASMKVSEQIDAMEVSATNPMRYLVVTRVLAATLMLPILVLFADGAGLFGSWIGINIKGDVNIILFFYQAFDFITFMDLFPALIKSFLFGTVIGLVGCYKGFTAERGTESVGKAANSSVVIASLMVILVDVIAVQITDMLV